MKVEKVEIVLTLLMRDEVANKGLTNLDWIVRAIRMCLAVDKGQVYIKNQLAPGGFSLLGILNFPETPQPAYSHLPRILIPEDLVEEILRKTGVASVYGFILRAIEFAIKEPVMYLYALKR